MARILVAANALWILLSRPDLPTLDAWPDPFFAAAGPLRIRYGVVLPESIDRILYWVAVVALLLTMAGVAARVSAFLAGLLLYHFAPFENLISSRVGPYFNGFTLPVLALLIIAFAPAPSDDRRPDHRWPFALIQLLFAFTYLFAGLSKLRYSGLGWMSGQNLRSTIEVFNAFEPADRPFARFLIEHPVLCTIVALATIVMELAIVSVLIWPKLAFGAVPLLLLGHVGIYLSLGVVFLNAPLVLLFFDWDR